MAVASRHLAHRVGSFAPDEAFTCGLLSQIGRLGLASVFPDEYADALYAVATDGSEQLVEIERRVFGIDHNKLAAEMMSDWHLPVLFCDAVRAQGAPDTTDIEPNPRTHLLARILHLGGFISLILTQPTVHRDTLSVLVQDADRLSISPYVFHETFDAISREWCEAGGIFSVRTRLVPPLAEIYSQAREYRESLQEQSDPASRLPREGYYARG